MPEIFSPACIPLSVADETRWSYEWIGKKLVPNLDATPYIEVRGVPEKLVRRDMAELFTAHERRVRGPRFAAKTPPVVAEYQGKMIAWTKRHRRIAMSIPDLEVLVLAKRMKGAAIVDDKRALRAAAELGVPSMTTREVLALLVERGFLSGTDPILKRIIETGYHPTQRPASP